MFTISVLGLDQFLVGDYSFDFTGQIADILETNPDEISFFAPEGIMFHNGVDQNSYNVIVRVEAPNKYRVFEKVLASFIKDTLKTYVIHMTVQFSSYSEENTYEYLNDEYRLYMTEENTVKCDDDFNSEEDDEDIYEGNIFDGFEEKYQEAHSHDDDCCCGDDDECECGCHHKH